MSEAAKPVQDAPSPDGAGPMRLTYLIGRYPVLTETFIDREILQLIERGVDLKLVSIRQPDAELSPRQRELRQRVTYLMPVSVVKLVVAHVTALVGRPRTYLGTLAWLLTRPHPKGTRPRTALHFATGVYAAWVLRGRRGVHIHAHFADRAATVALVASRFLDTTYSVTAHAREIYVAPVLLRERLGHAAFTATCTEYNRRHLATVVDAATAGSILRLYHGLRPEHLHRLGMEQRPRSIHPCFCRWRSCGEREGARGPRPGLPGAGRPWHRRLVPDRRRAPAARAARGADRRAGPWRPRRPHRRPAPSRGGGPARAGTGLRAALRGGARRLPRRHPNVILEAMASGLPVISTPVSGIPEVVRDGETGFLRARARPDGGGRCRCPPPGRCGPRQPARRAAGRAFVREEFDLDRNVERL